MLPLTQIKLLAVSLLISTISFGQTIILNETFSGSSLPSGWSNSDNAGYGDKWAFNDPGNRSISAGNFSGNYAIVDSDHYGNSSTQESELRTPSFNASIYETVSLQFDHQYRDYDGPEYCRVQVYNGSSWATVLEYVIGDENYSGSDRVTIDITAATGGNANAKVQFKYKGDYDWWWAIDNVKITGVEPVLVANPKGPGGIGTNDGSSSLVAWYTPNNLRDASNNVPSDNEMVKYWLDASGKNRTVTNSGTARFQTSTSDLINGYPKLTASGLNRQFFTSNSVSGRTVVAVTNPGSKNSFEGVVGFNGDKGIRRPSSSDSKWQYAGGGDGVNNDTWSTNTGSSYVNGASTNTGVFNNTLHFVSQTRPSNYSNTFYIGGYYPNRSFSGDLTEVIVFDEELTLAEKIILDNYLSAKYDISMAASGSDYYTQDNSGSGDFDHNVAGIGQASDGSIHNNSQGTGIIKINTPSSLGTNDYLFWGENVKDATYEFGTNSTDYMDRLNSTWRVSRRNNPGTVSVSVAAADLNLTNKQSCAPLKLVVSSLSNFSTKTTYDLTLVDGIYTAINVDFTDGDYFTFEYQDVIAVDNSKFYNGSGSSSAPSTSDACYKLLVKNTANGTFNLTQDANVREVEIETGGLITINSGFTLTSDNDIENNGTITIEEDASLIQNTTGANNNSGSGNYIIKRTGNTNPYVYNIWSSPITSASEVSIFSNSNPCDIWVFDRFSQAWSYDFPVGYTTSCNGNNVTFSSSDVIQGGDGIMDVCGGYFVPGNTASLKTYNGTVNNGDYSKAISITNLGNPGGNDWGDDDWNLLGNPYPSALSAAAFWTENAINNSRITDALYFWDEADTTNGYNQNSDYASWNLLGGLNSGNSNKIPNGNIASGQGFWVVGLANTSVAFDNTMRSGTNDQYFKTGPIENHIAWIGVTSPSGNKNNVLVGYNDVTTDALDASFDAHKLLGNSHIRLASIIDGEEFSIQGFEKLGLGDKKVIPLVLFTGETGVHTFNEYKRENLPANVKIYIRDLRMGAVQDLAKGDYTVSVNGNQTYENRFELVFEMTMGSNDNSQSGKITPATTTTDVASVENENDFTLIKSKDGYTLSNPNGVNGDLKVLDVTGKVVWSQSNISSTDVNINIENISAGFYFIQLINGSEQVYQHKLMNP